MVRKLCVVRGWVRVGEEWWCMLVKVVVGWWGVVKCWWRMLSNMLLCAIVLRKVDF